MISSSISNVRASIPVKSTDVIGSSHSNASLTIKNQNIDHTYSSIILLDLDDTVFPTSGKYPEHLALQIYSHFVKNIEKVTEIKIYNFLKNILPENIDKLIKKIALYIHNYANDIQKNGTVLNFYTASFALEYIKNNGFENDFQSLVEQWNIQNESTYNIDQIKNILAFEILYFISTIEEKNVGYSNIFKEIKKIPFNNEEDINLYLENIHLSSINKIKYPDIANCTNDETYLSLKNNIQPNTLKSILNKIMPSDLKRIFEVAQSCNKKHFELSIVNQGNINRNNKIHKEETYFNNDIAPYINNLSATEQQVFTDTFIVKPFDDVQSLTRLKDNGCYIIGWTNGSIWENLERTNNILGVFNLDTIITSARKEFISQSITINKLTGISTEIKDKKIPVYVIGDRLNLDINASLYLENKGFNTKPIWIDRGMLGKNQELNLDIEAIENLEGYSYQVANTMEDVPKIIAHIENKPSIPIIQNLSSETKRIVIFAFDETLSSTELAERAITVLTELMTNPILGLDMNKINSIAQEIKDSKVTTHGSATDIIFRAFPEKSIKYGTLYNRLSHATILNNMRSIFEDVLSPLTKLQSDNSIFILASNGTSKEEMATSTKKYLPNIKFADIFLAEKQNRKPKPDLFVQSLNNLNLDNINTLPIHVVGDRVEHDMELSKNLNAIGFNTQGILIDRANSIKNNSLNEQFSDVKNNLSYSVIQTMQDLPTVIENLEQNNSSSSESQQAA